MQSSKISKSILDKYNLDPYYVRGRIDPGEENQSDITKGWNLDLIEISCDQIPTEIIDLMNRNVQFENTQTAQLLSFIIENTPSEIPPLNTRKRKGDAIRSRQIAK